MGVAAKPGVREPIMTIEEKKAVVRRYAEEVCSHGGNLDVADEVIGASWAGGPERMKTVLADFRKSFPDLRREIKDMVVEGDKVVIYATFTGTHRESGKQFPYAPTNETISMPGVWTFVVKEGRIVDELWNCDNYEKDWLYPLTRATVRRWFEEGWSKGIEEAHAMIDELFAPDVVLTGPPFPPTKGAEAYKQDVSLFKKAFPDLRFTLDEAVAEGDKVACRYTGRGTHQGEFLGIAPSGRQIVVGGSGIARFANGKIAEVQENFDFWGLVRQIGATPADLARIMEQFGSAI